MLTSAQQSTLEQDMEKWYVSVADYACKTSKGIKTKNDIGCLEAQLQIIATLYNNISTIDLLEFQYPIWQSCENQLETIAVRTFECPAPSVGGAASFNYTSTIGLYPPSGASVSLGNVSAGDPCGDLKKAFAVWLQGHYPDSIFTDLGSDGFSVTTSSLSLDEFVISKYVVNGVNTFPTLTTISTVTTSCNTQAQNGTLTQASINCLLAKLTEGVTEGTGSNVTPNYIMWGTDMVNDILDYGTSSNQHIKWRF